MAIPESAPRPAAPSREAIVTEVADDRVTVQAVDGGAIANVRVAVVGYRPAEGDRVLLTETASSTFIIGVVASSLAVSVGVEDGCIVIRAPDGEVVLRHDPEAGQTRIGAGAGDLLLEAPEGTVRLKAEAVELDADTITSRAREVMTIATRVGFSVDRWDVRAHRIKERAVDVLRRVDGKLITRAGRLRTVVKRSAQLLAKRTTIRSEEETAIDGRQVLLG